MNTQEQTFSKPIETDSKDEYHLTENTDKTSKLTEQMSTNITEDRKDDVKDKQVTDQILIQENGITSKQTEFTIPFKKPNTVNADDHRNNDDESIKKDIIKAIQNINGDHEQTDSQFNFRSTLSDKPIEIISTDFRKIQHQVNNTGQAQLSSKRSKLPKKPLRIFGFNPSNLHNEAHFIESKDDVKMYNYDSSGVYQTSSTIQTGNYKGNQKYKEQIPSQPLYYYDPTSKAMFPIYTDLIQNSYPFVENNHQQTFSLVENKPQQQIYSLVEIKPQSTYLFTDNKPQSTHPFAEKKPQDYPFTEKKPQPPYQVVDNKPKPSQPQSDSSKNGFNLMQILNGGSFYKGSEQAEGSQQTAVKDFTKQESKKLEKLKPHETLEKSKPQTLMFYLNPGKTPLASSPELFTFGQQPQADCNGKNLKPSTVKADKPLQQIPLCSDCIPALGLMGLQNTKSTAAQQKKSITSPQVMPIWNGPNSPKLNYLILPTPINK